MIINQNITDTIGHLAFCLNHFKMLKENLGNPKKINPQTHHNNVESTKNAILFHFQQYMGIRKTYNQDIMAIEDILTGLEKDFTDIISIFGEPSQEQIVQLQGIIFKIQKSIVGEIQINPTYIQQLKQNFPEHFK